MKKHIKRIGNIASTVIIVLLVIFIAVLFINRSQNKVTYIGDKAMVWIVSPSMEPLIPEYSYIQIERASAADIEVGDIIMFYSDDPRIEGFLNTHKVVEIIGDHEEFVTRGINNPTNDELTAKADKLVGRYTKNLPFLTALMRFFLSPSGFIIIVLLFVAITLALVLPDIIKYSKDKRAKDREALEKERDELVRLEVERLRREAEEKEKREE